MSSAASALVSDTTLADGMPLHMVSTSSGTVQSGSGAITLNGALPQSRAEGPQSCAVMRVLRTCGGIDFFGTFLEYWLDSDGTQLYRVRYDDGDIEDLVSSDFVHALELFATSGCNA